jgi:hypothetical protein
MLQIFKKVQAGDICRFAPVLESFVCILGPKFFLPRLKNVALDLYRRICSFAGYSSHAVRNYFSFKLQLVYTE